MNTKIAYRVFRILFACFLVLSVAWMPTKNASADWPFPVFMLNVNNDSSWRGLDAWNWPLGTQVTLTVDDPATPQNPDYTEVQIMGEPNPGQSTISHAMYMQNYDIEGHFKGHPGFIITLSDGIETKSMTVPLFTVTGVDLVNDTISGRSVPLTEWVVPISSADGSQYAERKVTTDANGNWTADFAVSNIPDEVILDLQPGACGDPQFFEADWDHVVLRYWCVPDPIFTVRFHENEVHGYDWLLGSPVTLNIDDPNTVESVDYTETQTTVMTDGDANQTFVQFRPWENNFEIENGQIVTMTDGTITKTHVIAVPRITGIISQSGNSQVEGLAASLSEIWVDFKGATRHETADGTGHWLADFHVPGDEDFETQTIHIDAWNEGEVHVQDEDGDSTSTNWGRGLLMLELESDGSPQQHVYIRHWPGRQPVTLLIDDPATPQNPDYTDIHNMRRSDGYSRLTIDWAEVFDVRPGFTITVTDGYVTKSMIVPLLAITGYDLANDTISGISSPFAKVLIVGPCSLEDCSNPTEIEVVANSNGNWLANFVNIQPGDGYEAQIYDEDSDHTVLRDWSVRMELKGFYQPVDMNGIYNIVKSGSTVPFKFEVFAGSTELTDVAHIQSLTSVPISCEANAIADAIETTVTGNTSLHYDVAAGQFIYNWKTPRTAGQCYRVTVITIDGSSIIAYFKLK